MYDSPPMTTASGQGVYFDEPWRTKIVDLDIRTGLANTIRYHGQFPFSVLAHSLLVASILGRVSPRLGALGALHDMHEAYCGDHNPGEKTDRFRLREALWSDYVHQHYAIELPTEHEQWLVKQADRSALMAEMVVLGHPAAYWAPERWKEGKPTATAEDVDQADMLRHAPPDVLWGALMEFVTKGGGIVNAALPSVCGVDFGTDGVVSDVVLVNTDVSNGAVLARVQDAVRRSTAYSRNRFVL